VDQQFTAAARAKTQNPAKISIKEIHYDRQDKAVLVSASIAYKYLPLLILANV